MSGGFSVKNSRGESLAVRPLSDHPLHDSPFYWAPSPDGLATGCCARFHLLKYLSKTPPVVLEKPESDITVLLRYGPSPSGYIGTTKEGLLLAVNTPNTYSLWKMQAFEGGHFALSRPTGRMLSSTATTIDLAPAVVSWSTLFTMPKLVPPASQSSYGTPPNTPNKNLELSPNHVSSPEKELNKFPSQSQPQPNSRPQSQSQSRPKSSRRESIVDLQPETLTMSRLDVSLQSQSSALIQAGANPLGNMLGAGAAQTSVVIRPETVTAGPLVQTLDPPTPPNQQNRPVASTKPQHMQPVPPAGPTANVNTPISIFDAAGRCITGATINAGFQMENFSIREKPLHAVYFDIMLLVKNASPWPTDLFNLNTGDKQNVVLQNSKSKMYLAAPRNGNAVTECPQIDANAVWEYRKLPHNPLAFALYNCSTGRKLSLPSAAAAAKRPTQPLLLEHSPTHLASSFMLYITPSTAQALQMQNAEKLKWIHKASPWFGAIGALSGVITGGALVGNFIAQGYRDQAASSAAAAASASRAPALTQNKVVVEPNNLLAVDGNDNDKDNKEASEQAIGDSLLALQEYHETSMLNLDNGETKCFVYAPAAETENIADSQQHIDEFSAMLEEQGPGFMFIGDDGFCDE